MKMLADISMVTIKDVAKFLDTKRLNKDKQCTLGVQSDKVKRGSFVLPAEAE